jgi:hypothetical protein
MCHTPRLGASLRYVFLPVVVLIFSFMLGQTARGQAPSAPSPQSEQRVTSPALPAAWNDGVKALAEKIVAAVKPSRAISLEVKNISSLGPVDVETIRKVLEAELANRGLRLGSVGDEVEVTLSENSGGYLWVAEIRKNGTREVVMVPAPKKAVDRSAESQKSVVLAREIVSVQSEKILDFSFTPSQITDSPNLAILEPERWVAHDPYGSGAIPIVHSVPWPRDLSGRIDIDAGKFAIPGMNCDGGIANAEPIRCTPAQKGSATSKYAQQESVEIDGRNVASVTLYAACTSAEIILLATGAGDWTEPDWLRAYKVSGELPVALSQPVEFPGPILTLWSSKDGKSARVISKNLQTGMYEASVVTVTCSQ